MIYTIETRHVFGGRDTYMETHYEVREFTHRNPDGCLTDAGSGFGRIVYSCKYKRQAVAYCKAHGIEPQPKFIAPEED